MIYYVEDDTNIRDLTVYALRQAGYEAKGFANAGDFFAACKEHVPELVLLDIMLPEVDGLEILHVLREDAAMKHVPIMMLTAKGTEYDTVCGLDAGADDYLVKPFGSDELAMRIGAHLRRQQRTAAARPADVVEYEGLRIDLHKRKVTKRGEPVSLTPKEFDILAILASDAGSIFTREQLTLAVWGEEYAGETLGVAVYIRRIREKLEDVPSKPVYVQTVWREGYRFGE